MDRGLGRIKPVEDPKDRNYPMRLRLGVVQELVFPRGIPPGSRHFLPAPKIINQGMTGTCVAHGLITYLAAPPIMQPFSLTPYDLYRRIVASDVFSGNDHEATAPDHMLQYGTDERSGLEVLRSMGYIANYLWAESIEDARGWIMASMSGLVGGFPWTTGMMDTDSDGFINYTGQEEGGHFIYLGGWNDRVKRRGRYVRAIRMQQSWQLPWGHKGGGRAWIVEDDLAKMMQDGGKIAAPVETRVVPLKVAA
jgi:hypothetical protein